MCTEGVPSAGVIAADFPPPDGADLDRTRRSVEDLVAAVGRLLGPAGQCRLTDDPYGAGGWALETRTADAAGVAGWAARVADLLRAGELGPTARLMFHREYGPLILRDAAPGVVPELAAVLPAAEPDLDTSVVVKAGAVEGYDTLLSAVTNALAGAGQVSLACDRPDGGACFVLKVWAREGAAECVARVLDAVRRYTPPGSWEVSVRSWTLAENLPLDPVRS